MLYYPTHLALELKKRGLDVHVVVGCDKEQSPNLRRLLLSHNIGLHLAACLEMSGLRALVTPNGALHSVVRNLSPDVIHCFGPITAFQKSWPDLPRHKTCVMVAAMASTSKGPWMARIGSLLLNRYADVVLAQCSQEYERLRRAGVPQRKLGIMYSPLACDDLTSVALKYSGPDSRKLAFDRFSIDPSSRLIGCFANLYPWKRQDLLIKAFAGMSPQIPGWRLLLAGEGSERTRYENLAAALGISRRVHFLGRLNNMEAIQLLASVDVAVHCSNAETFGYSMLEPLLLGRPTVITRIGIGHEIERARQAVVVETDNLDALITGLERAISLDDDVRAMTITGPRYIRENFDVSVIADRLISVYGQL